MIQHLSLKRLILISSLVHLGLVILLLLNSQIKIEDSVSFKTQVFFEKSSKPKTRQKRKVPPQTKRVEKPEPEPLKITKIPQQDTPLEPLPISEEVSPDELENSPNRLENSPKEIKSGDAIKTFARSWQRKNQVRSYKATLARIVSGNWVLPPVNKKIFQILIETIIKPDGTILQTNFIKKTGFTVLDTAALKSIQISAPFPEFDGFQLSNQKTLRIVFRFTHDRIEY
jgi:outer membrane biosynthesis protein TonB